MVRLKLQNNMFQGTYIRSLAHDIGKALEAVVISQHYDEPESATIRSKMQSN